MAEIIEIDDHRPHITAELACMYCKGRAICCWMEDTPMKDLECGHCGEVGGLIKTGQYLR
jgi:hypothetical protein